MTGGDTADTSPFGALRVGHATDADARTGCTVLLGPFRAACDIRGSATGTRELDPLTPTHVVPRIDALLLTGGSAFGLAAAEGVVAFLAERGAGFETPVARVPIVPAAVVYDLGVGRPDRRPDAAMGRAACEAAAPWPPAEGRVGAGTGASVGKLLGPQAADPGGVGCWTHHGPEYTIGALAVVNAVGDIRDAKGRIIAGARSPDGEFADTAKLLRERGHQFGDRFAARSHAASNTTLAAIVTDAPLDRLALLSLANMAATAFARRIAPVHTPFDGDVVFAISVTEAPAPIEPHRLMAVGASAAFALERAIERAVTGDLSTAEGAEGR